MEIDNSIRKITISPLKANILALIFIAPTLALFYLPFHFLHGIKGFITSFNQFSPYFIPVLIIGILLHELLHGVTWAIFCKYGFHSIQYGVIWKYLTPYAHCKEALKVGNYRLGTLMPGLVLGIIPIVIAYLNGSGFLLVIGLVFLLAAGGDMTMLFLLRKIKKELWIMDHPNEIGCFVIEKSVIEEADFYDKSILEHKKRHPDNVSKEKIEK
jgi:hypothetical protein